MKQLYLGGTIVLVLVLLAAGLSLYGYNIQTQKKQNQTNLQEFNKLPVQSFDGAQKVFENLSLQADAVLIKNLATNQVVFEKHSEKVLPLASLAKIMTTITALRLVDEETKITFSETAISQIGDQGFTVGEQLTLEQLIPFMLVTSSNDAGYAIAETIERITGKSFVASMNDVSSKLGFQSFTFENPTGLDSVSSKVHASATGNVQDVADLLLYATKQYPSYFSTSSAAISRVNGHRGVNTNTLANSVPGFLASKTGFTSTAGGNLAFIVEIGPNQPFVVVVMGSSFEGRFTDARKIIEALYTVVGESIPSI